MKIPRVFHRIWLGGQKMPSPFEWCGKSWTRLNPDWELKTWTETELQSLPGIEKYIELIRNSCHLSQQSNIYRYLLMLLYGGVYIDTDCECLKPIEPLIGNIEVFGAYKKDTSIIMSAIFGATAGHPWLQDLVDGMSSRDPSKSLSLGSEYITFHTKRHPEVHCFPSEIFCPISPFEAHRNNEQFPSAYGIHYWTSTIFPTGFKPLPNTNLSLYHGIPTMTPRPVLDYLAALGRNWTGAGLVMELGSWLGGTAAALLDGLKTRHYSLPFLAYDYWQATPDEVYKAKEFGVIVRNRENLLPLFLRNTNYEKMKTFKGNIEDALKEYAEGPIEICLVDALKTDPSFSSAMEILWNHWIPGVTVLGLMDYHFHRKKNDNETFMAPVRFIERHKKSFVKIAEWPESECVFFRFIG